MRNVASHLAAAAVAALLVVLFYELRDDSSTAEPRPGERQSIGRASLRPHVLPDSRPEASPRGGRTTRRTAAELETRVAELEDRLELMGAQRKIAEAEGRPRVRFVNLTADEKLEMARNCEIRSDVPFPLSEESISDFGLSDAEVEAWGRAWEKFDRKRRGELVDLWEEATGERVDDVDWRQSHSTFIKLGTDADRARVRQRIAQERAGLKERPSELSGRSIYERWKRLFEGRGDDFELALAEELGSERAHELREANDGWPGGRMRNRGCPKERDATE